MNIGQTELIGLSLSQGNISVPSARIRDTVRRGGPKRLMALQGHHIRCFQ